jgi:phospholipid transport system substrate-binding protein
MKAIAERGVRIAMPGIVGALIALALGAGAERLARDLPGAGSLAHSLHAAEAISTDTPAATVDSLHRGLVALARVRPTADLAERYRALEPLISQTHDLPYIAEFALRRQWPSLGEADRQRFVQAFSKLSIMTYASRFKNVSAEAFKRVGEEPGTERAQVLAAIARPGQPDVPLEYVLQRKEGRWLIVNIVADGVSDLALKRAEYQRVLSTGTIDDLIEHLDAQTARLQ